MAATNSANSLIETNSGYLNCKTILFLPLNASNSISEFVSKSLHYLFNHPKKYNSIAFSATEYDLRQGPIDTVITAMINTTVIKLNETKVQYRVSFVISPNEYNKHQEFANKLSSIQKHTEPIGSIKCSFSR